MITTTRNITDGKIVLVERLILRDEDELRRGHPTDPGSIGKVDSSAGADPDYMQFACKIAEKNTRTRGNVTIEPVFKWFNAPSRKSAFEYADANIEVWVDELKAAVNKPKIKLAQPGEVNRMRLNGA